MIAHAGLVLIPIFRRFPILVSMSVLIGAANLCQAAGYTTFLGDANPYKIARSLTDSSGNTYVAGTRIIDQASDAFAAKLDASGNTVFFRVISGGGMNTTADLAIDAAGNLYIAGSTTSADFPVRDALQSIPGPGFLVKLSADGTGSIWSTYFREAITALAVDATGNVYITGRTNDPQFPVTAGLPAGPVTPIGYLSSVSGTFITKIDAAGDHIIYSGVISGSDKPCGCCSSCFLSARNTAGASLAIDASGNAYLAGNTDTSNIPTTSGALLATGTGAFVAKAKADGSGLVYLTYIGPTNYPASPSTNPANTATAIACDNAGDAYLTGSTSDPKFPATAGAWQTTYAGPANANSPASPPTDAFALELNPAGTGVVWASYLGGPGVDTANSLSLDSSNQAWLAGTTASDGFPNAQGWSQGSDFIAGFNANGSKLVYSARYPNDAVSRSIAVDGGGLLHVAGPTGFVSTISAASTPVTRIFGVANSAYGPLDGRIAGGEVISIYGPHIGPATPAIISPDSSGNLPTSANGYQVELKNPGLLGTQPLPLLYVSDSQINAVVPFGVSGPTVLSAITPTITAANFTVTPVNAIPEIFRNADGTAVAVNQDGTMNSPSNQAPVGSTVSIWITGANLEGPGAFGYPGYAGFIATAAKDYHCCGALVGGLMAEVSYAGAAPGAALGVAQVNIQIPPVFPIPGSPTTSVQVIANDGTLSHEAGIYVH